MNYDEEINRLKQDIAALRSGGAGWNRFPPLLGMKTIWCNPPLTSTDWDGDARSTTAKTLIDLSAVFGAPAGIKAVLVRIQVWDSASGAATSNWMGVSPNNTDGSLAVVARCAGLPNNVRGDDNGICPCDANGDIYFQNAASGSLTQGSDMQIWGYWL